jgi:NADH-quinone oxidoreductase subunit D
MFNVAAPAGAHTLTLNLGPQHPSTQGALRLVLELDGETVVRATPEIGYLHSGIEKSCEAMTYHQAVTLTERLDYLAPLTNNLCYVLAVEKLIGLEPPSRAVWTRVLLNELTRIGSHLAWLGTHAMEMGAVSVFLSCFREREDLLKFFETVSGQRVMTSYFRVGGLAHDPPPELFQAIKKFIRDFPARLEECEDLLTRNPSWIGRTRGVGRLSMEDALDFSVSGPSARASGIDWDLRRDLPYSGYDQFHFDVPVRLEGDVHARYLVRMQEIRESIRIVGQAIDGMPTGPVLTELKGVILPTREQLKRDPEVLNDHFKIVTEGYLVPAGEVYQAVESPRGEMGYFVVSEGATHPYRVKVRSPSYANLQALPRIAEGRTLYDLVACLGSLDLVLGEIDR